MLHIEFKILYDATAARVALAGDLDEGIAAARPARDGTDGPLAGLSPAGSRADCPCAGGVTSS